MKIFITIWIQWTSLNATLLNPTHRLFRQICGGTELMFHYKKNRDTSLILFGPDGVRFKKRPLYFTLKLNRLKSSKWLFKWYSPRQRRLKAHSTVLEKQNGAICGLKSTRLKTVQSIFKDFVKQPTGTKLTSDGDDGAILYFDHTKR